MRSPLGFLIRSTLLGIIVAALLLLLIPELRSGNSLVQGWLNGPDPREGRVTYHDALSRAAPAVVNIYSISIENGSGLFRRQPRERTNLGSGVMMTSSGYLLTCYHVVQNADSIYVALQDSRVMEAQIVGFDQLTDLAVLKVSADNLTVIPQLETPDIRVGDMVMAIGNPYDLGQTITQGIVSRAGHNGLSNYVDYIQTDAVLNQGNSGGALVDSKGNLVGITNANFQIRDRRRGVRNVDGINFAVPYELAKRVMDEIITSGKVTRGQLGFEGREHTDRPGIEVTNVAPNSPAALAGLRPEDIILAIDGVRLESALETQDMIAETTPGTEIELVVSRDGDLLTMTAVIAELDV
ncbi:PDZ domain-containing protein [Alteromonas sediminis]|uniref:PDZ domain-containing protein n=1 Tax=Alteromonas sediminis TaxID=2259342 RepID=A0A3N5Y445_9ALTE|nr:PDZ domain-containing protein [Alteromonas sediminis]